MGCTDPEKLKARMTCSKQNGICILRQVSFAAIL